MSKIKIKTIDEMVEITAGLVKQGVQFESYWENGYWIINFTGGY
jgi:hypothetical protein